MTHGRRAPYVRGTAVERFWPKVNKAGPVPELNPDLGPCWLWTANRDCTFNLEAGVTCAAHRFAYEQVVGPVPADRPTLFRLCANPLCVNPGHVEPVTVAEATRRQMGVLAARGGRPRRERCRQGHLRSTGPSGRLVCPTCSSARARQRYTPRQTCQNGHQYPAATTTAGKRRRCQQCLADKRRNCSVDGCDQLHSRRGHCELHARRLEDYGTTAAPAARTEAERFWAKVTKSDGHWIWTGRGLCFRSGGRSVKPARWAWIDQHGVTPEKLYVACGVAACVRPDHMQTAPPLATHCSAGHEFTPENTRTRKNGERICRRCHSIRNSRRKPAGTEGIEYIEILRADPCSYCGAPTEHIDHIVPIAAGGARTWDNLTAACQPCNQSKSVRPLLTFLLERCA